MAQPSLVFTVRRQEPELVAPATPTPRELKPLSDLDSQEALRFHMPALLIYRNNPSTNGKDPVKVIREAIAQALVFYYPLAGRLRAGPGRKLSVDCTGEGVLFIEADADVALVDFGPVLQPPFPCVEELLFDVPGSARVLDCPLLLIQVTRLTCGGFIFALRILHSISDASGKGQFMTAIAEMARGALSPSTLPTWNRHFFCARDPPRGTYSYPDHFGAKDTSRKPFEDLIEKSFFFGVSHVSALRRSAPQHLRHCSTFDVITAFLWRCRTVALQFDPNEEVHVLFVVSARGRKFNPPVPSGYYGNAFATTVAASTVGRLRRGSFGYALELVRKAKDKVNEEYVRSFIDQSVTIARDRPPPAMPGVRCFIVTDVTRGGFADVDFGWGPAAYAGPSVGAMGPTQRLSTTYTSHKNHKGEEEIVARMCLPRAAMRIFEHELNSMLNDNKSRL